MRLLGPEIRNELAPVSGNTAQSRMAKGFAPVLIPHGHLLPERGDEWAPLEPEAALQLQESFDRGTGHGLLTPGAALVGVPLPSAFGYWRDLSARYVTDTAGHSDKIIRRLERDIFPWLGGRPIAEITAPELLAVLRRIESRGAIETAHRAQQNCSQVFRYAVATGRAERDPTADLRPRWPPKFPLRGALTNSSSPFETR